MTPGQPQGRMRGAESGRGPQSRPLDKPMDPLVTVQMVVQMALADAQRFGKAPAQVLVAESVIWNNGAMGCPRPGMLYTDALVPGYRVQLQVGHQVLDYHAGRDGRPWLCPPERVVAPTPDMRAR